MNELTIECMMNPTLYDKYKTIQDSIKKNAKYYFENGKEIKENG